MCENVLSGCSEAGIWLKRGAGKAAGFVPFDVDEYIK
jgi:hypothetical protein